MIVDFKLETDTENNVLQSKNGFIIEMDSSCRNEIPVITNDLNVLFIQSVAIMGTINQGQIKDNESYGVTPLYKVKMSNVSGLDDIYRTKILTELSNLVLDLFTNNQELLDYIAQQYSSISIGDYNG